MADMSVDLVAIERRLWSGQASFVGAQTTEGQIGILHGHEPVLGQLAEGGFVSIESTEGERIVAAVDRGVLCSSGEGVRIDAESAEFAADIDIDAARAVLADPNSSEQEQNVATARLRAVEAKTD